jgi:hypothetical protein
MPQHNLQLAHELDAAWIIALWKAIHGGDPSPQVVASQAIAALAPYLNTSEDTLTFSQLEKQFKTLGADIMERDAEAPAMTDALFPVRQYFFNFKDETYCVQLPKLGPARPGMYSARAYEFANQAQLP